MFPRLSTLLVAVAFALPAFSVSAQEVHFSGRVENGKGVCYYCPGYDFVLDNTHTSLTSPTVNLTPYIGGYVRGVGHWNGSYTLPVIVVDSVELFPQEFTIGGSSAPGTKVKFSVFGTQGDFAIIALSFHDAFFNMGNLGALFLSTQGLFVLGQGSIGSSGGFEIKVEIPDNPALVGLNLFGQAAILHADGTQSLTNPDRKVIG